VTPLDLDMHLTRLRLVKSAEEMEMIQAGAVMSDAALLALRAEAKPGMSEHDLVAIVEAAYLPDGGVTHIHYLGATSMAEPDLCVPRQFATERRLIAGDVILTELSAAREGYYGQVLRTLTVGAAPSPEYVRLHDLALLVYDRVCDAIHPGVSSEAILDIAETIHNAGCTIYDDLSARCVVSTPRSCARGAPRAVRVTDSRSKRTWSSSSSRTWSPRTTGWACRSAT
jgi:Xaa-Pro dipeptidase